MECGREPGGANADKLGVCDAASNSEFDGVNGGLNAGRVCWAVTGTLCGGRVQGTFAQKQISCMNCKFFKLVMKEEGIAIQLRPTPIIR